LYCSPDIISHEMKEDEMVVPCINMEEVRNEVRIPEEILYEMVVVDGRILWEK